MRLRILGLVPLLALVLWPAAAGARINCGRIRANGFLFDVTIQHGHARCREARDALRTFLSGGGVEHGGASSPSYLKTWTLRGGWRCGFGTNGGGCTRKHPYAVILAQTHLSSHTSVRRPGRSRAGRRGQI